MSSWVFLVLGLAAISALVLVTKRWGKASVERKVLKRTIEAARTRKAIDNEIQNLDPDSLAERLRSGL